MGAFQENSNKKEIMLTRQHIKKNSCLSLFVFWWLNAIAPTLMLCARSYPPYPLTFTARCTRLTLK